MKKHAPLGFIEKTCSRCDGIGYCDAINSPVDTPISSDSIPLSFSADDFKPVEMKPIDLDRKESVKAKLKAKLKGKKRLSKNKAEVVN